jgi:hypothetical protein
MDGLIVIRSVTLSNHIAWTQLPEGVETRAIKSQRRSKKWRIISEQFSFQGTPKTILKYF